MLLNAIPMLMEVNIFLPSRMKGVANVFKPLGDQGGVARIFHLIEQG
jgi:hypothetical protein